MIPPRHRGADPGMGTVWGRRCPGTRRYEGSRLGAEAVEGANGVSSPESCGDARLSGKVRLWESVELLTVAESADKGAAPLQDFEPVFPPRASRVCVQLLTRPAMKADTRQIRLFGHF